MSGLVGGGMRGSKRRDEFGWPRAIAAAFAVLALLVQSLAPVAIAPPKGQPVHFAHVHHGDADDAAASPAAGHERAGHAHHGAPANTADQHHPDGAECPVCKALQAAGAGIYAPAPTVAVAFAYPRRDKAAPEIAAPLARITNEHRARAPPMTA